MTARHQQAEADLPLVGTPVLPRVRRAGAARALLVVAVAAVLVAAQFAVLLVASLHAVPGNSDGATVLLEGASMRHGHLLLHGWRLSLDSFWLVDVPFYALGVLVAGVRPLLLNAVPAAIAAGVVAVGVAMAAEGRRGGPRLAGMVAVVALLGLPGRTLSTFFLQGPLHVGTVLWCLVAFWFLRIERRGAPWLAATVALTTGILGDAQTLALGTAPVLVAGLVAIARARSWRAGAWRVYAVGASVALAAAVRAAAAAVGSFAVTKTGTSAAAGQMARNLGRLPGDLGQLLGLGSSGGSGAAPLELVHAVAFGAVAAGVAAGLGRLVAGPSRTRRASGAGEDALDELLTVAFVADLAVFCFLADTAGVAYDRYLTAAVVFGSILGARLVARLAAAVADDPRRRRRRSGAGAAAALAVAAAVGLAVSFGSGLARAAPARTAAAVSRFLLAHGLRRGLGDYWDASIVTVESRGQVRVRPAVEGPGGRLAPFPRNAARRWYDGVSFWFLLYRPSAPFGGVDGASAAATFGSPAHRFAVDGYAVLVWRGPHCLVSCASARRAGS